MGIALAVGLLFAPCSIAESSDGSVAESAGTEKDDPNLVEKVGSTVSDMVAGKGSSQTWNTEASDSDAAAKGAKDLGVDDRVGTGMEIQEDADAAEAELKHLGVQFKVSATKSTWDFWWKDGYYFIENRDEFN